MASSISRVSLSRKFHLNSRIYNISDKIKDRYVREKDRDGNKVL